MTSGGGEPRPRGLADRLIGGVAIAGGLCSLATAAIVVVSVLLRKPGIGSVPGDFEMVQMATAVAVFSFLPLTQWRGGNIVVDTFTNRLPAGASRALDALWSLVYAATMALIAWQLAIGARETAGNGTATMVLGLPLWPAVAICAGLSAFTGLVAAATALRPEAGRP